MYLLVFLLSLVSLEETMLETNGMMFKLFDHSNVQYDGSLTLVNKHTAYHLSSEGKLIRKFYGEGDGPGEFRYLSEALWDGSFYYLHDLMRRDVSVFDGNGKFLVRSKLRVRDRYYINGGILALDTIPFANGDKGGKPLIGLKLNQDFVLERSGLSFHYIPEVIFEWLADRKMHFLSVHNHQIYVATQLDTTVTIYDSDHKKQRSFKAELYKYVPPNEPW